MSHDPVPSEPGLDLTALHRLATLGELVRTAPPRERTIMIRATVDIARTYRGRAEWDAIATAIGVTPEEFSEWRSDHLDNLKPDTDIRLNHPQGAAPPDYPSVLIVTGHPNVRPDCTNDFTTETALIRQQCEIRYTVKEIAGIALADLRAALDDHQPTILHLAAHSDYGEIFLTHHGKPFGVTHPLLLQTLRRAQHKSTAIVLNFCGSLALAHQLAAADNIVIAWPSRVDDHQCREFNDTFYRRLVAGNSIGTSFDDAEITVSHWTGLLKPRLLGTRTTHI
ncbi:MULTISPECIES: hypothetical protein [unclassified Nocardia]|uniref:hypothetical protein n=1 Tax=unclassified Nocardia TaxID=2637762 RepID=UPI00278C57C9|nr:MULTISPECIES: hypothetical protein [unclassified Nocardia]